MSQLKIVCCLGYHVFFLMNTFDFWSPNHRLMYQMLAPKFKYIHDLSEKEYGTTKQNKKTLPNIDFRQTFRKYYPLESRVIDSREQGLLPWSANLTYTHFECLYIQIAFYCWVLSSSGYRILKPVVCTVPPKIIFTIISLLYRRPLKMK